MKNKYRYSIRITTLINNHENSDYSIWVRHIGDYGRKKDAITKLNELMQEQLELRDIVSTSLVEDGYANVSRQQIYKLVRKIIKGGE